MLTYYEVINVAPTATQSEIELALDAQYNKVRRLVTHHDSAVVNQANQALQLLETIRATLMDDGKRSAYNAAIGIGANFGGLADLSAAVSQSTPSFGFAVGVPPAQAAAPAARQLPPTQDTAQRMWICTKCKLPNVVNSQFCKSCGEPLAVVCPACTKLVEKGAQFCTHCGVNIPLAQQKKDIKDQLGWLRQDLDIVEKNVPVPEADLPELGKATVLGGAWAMISLIAAALYLLTPPNGFPGFDLIGLVLGLYGNSDYLLVDPRDILFAFGVLLVFSVLVLLLALTRKVSPLVGFGSALALILFMSSPLTTQSAFLMAGVPEGFARFFALVVASLIFTFVTGRILYRVKQNFEKIKPHYAKLPKLGCLGSLLGLWLYIFPALYAFYAFYAFYGFYGFYGFSGEPNLPGFIAAEYEFYIMAANALLLLIVGLLLLVYSLLAWKTAMAVETRFTQAAASRTQKMQKLSSQIKSLEQAFSAINVQPS